MFDLGFVNVDLTPIGQEFIGQPTCNVQYRQDWDNKGYKHQDHLQKVYDYFLTAKQCSPITLQMIVALSHPK